MPLTGVQAQGISIIRDAEIESYIRSWATPIWKVAGLDTKAVQVHLVNDKSLNAFVAGGQRIFIFTGLLNAVKDPMQVIGVLAHETGHITGGHLARFQDGLKGASTITIISLILGAAAIAAGAGDAGAAIMTSGGQFATRSFLSYSRTQESSADQAGIGFLEASHQSAHGLLSFFEYLGDQEALLTANKDPYVRSHPLTQTRIATLRNKAESSRYWLRPAPMAYVEMLSRTQAKLTGFLSHPSLVFRKYPLSDTSRFARYARAVAYHRQALTDQAISEIDSLLAESPNDPYYWELKGQIQFESGFSEKAIEPYRRAVKSAPREPLLRVGLAQAILATENPETAQEAIDNLNIANRYEGNNSFAWHQLALAYTLLDNKAMAALASAERFAISGGVRETLKQAHYAAEHLDEDTPQWVRAHDLFLLARNAFEDAYRRKGRKMPELPEEPRRKSDKNKEESADTVAENPDSDSIPSSANKDE